MRRRNAIALLAGLPFAAGTPALAQPALRVDTTNIDGIVVGAHVAVAIRTLGMPASVASLDSGHTWTWRSAHAELQAITDDGAIVRAVDDRPVDDVASMTLTLDGKPVRIGLRGYTSTRADAELNAAAELSSRTTRLFNLGRGRVAVMVFDDRGSLVHAVYGDRGFVARLGLVTADEEMVKSLRYSAPRLRGARAPISDGAHEAVIRYEIDRAGHVDSVAVEVSSNDPALDERALAIARKEAWMPAKLNNRAVSSIAFRIVAAPLREASH